jgi:hypothetical protein
VHPEAEAAGFDKMTTIMEIELEDGKVIERRPPRTLSGKSRR